jgi:hypothetical protein
LLGKSVIQLHRRNRIGLPMPGKCLCLLLLSLVVRPAFAQEIRFGIPTGQPIDDPVADNLLASQPRLAVRLPEAISPAPTFAVENTFDSGNRPEYPSSDGPTPAAVGRNLDSVSAYPPPALDWNLISDQVDLPTATLDCTSCDCSDLHSRSLPHGRRLASGIYAALCPCDECYQPAWDLQQSTAFFIDSARPQTRTRFGWDYGPNMILADRAEYFWARSGRLGPSPSPYTHIIPAFDYHQLTLYTEVGKGGFSFFTSMPYRSLYLRDAGHEAGFGDVQIGTKSLLHDSPLLQVAFQMTTTIPSAQPNKGLGTGHLALEPAILLGLKLTRNDMLQGQLAEWIPLGGDPEYSGALLRWGLSWNRLVWALDDRTQMTTSLELFGWSFQDGAYTDPTLGPLQKASNESYIYFGPGCRLLLCGKWEIGVGSAFALTERHFSEAILRSEFALRY